MHIVESNVSLTAKAYQERKRTTQTDLHLEIDLTRPLPQNDDNLDPGSTLIDLSPQAKLSTEEMQQKSSENNKVDWQIHPHLKNEFLIVKKMIEKLTGKSLRLLELPDLNLLVEENSEAVKNYKPRNDSQQPQWSLQIDYTEELYEKDYLEFSATGSVVTADGKKIAFALGLKMSSEHLSKRQLSIRAGNKKMVDPLVLNLGNSSTLLDNAEHEFDLTADGQTERIASLKDGVYYLALDKDSNANIDDGSELFGAITGDGFGELAVYDEDDNGWIDSGDSVFDRLRLWNPANKVYTKLKNQGVGAINLQAADTPFTLRNSHGETAGMMRNSSIFLKEDGQAGLISKIDLAL